MMSLYHTNLEFVALCGGYTALMLLMGGYALHRLKSGLRYIALRPDALLLLTLALVHGLIPLLKLLVGYERYQRAYNFDAHVWSIAHVATFAIAAMVGAATIRPPIPSAAYAPPGASRGEAWIFAIVVAAPAIFAGFYIRQAVENIGYAEFLTDRIGYGAQMRQWELLAYSLAVVPTMALLRLYGRGKKLTTAAWAVVLFGSAAIMFLASSAGGRNSAFIMLVTLLLVFTLVVQKIRARTVTALLSLLLIAALGFAIGGEYRKAVVLGSFQTELSSKSLVAALDQGFASHENVVWLLDHEHTPLWGVTYLAGVTNFVPRAMWSEKPLGGGPRLRNLIRPGSYEVGKKGITSYTTGAVAEAMMNFKWPGVVFIGFFNGVLLALCGAFVSRARSAHGLIIYIHFAVALSVTIVYSEFLGWFGRNVIVTALLILSAGICSLILPAVRYSAPPIVRQ